MIMPISWAGIQVLILPDSFRLGDGFKKELSYTRLGRSFGFN